MVNIAYLQCELYADCADAVRDQEAALTLIVLQVFCL